MKTPYAMLLGSMLSFPASAQYSLPKLYQENEWHKLEQKKDSLVSFMFLPKELREEKRSYARVTTDNFETVDSTFYQNKILSIKSTRWDKNLNTSYTQIISRPNVVSHLFMVSTSVTKTGSRKHEVLCERSFYTLPEEDIRKLPELGCPP